jgi:predicted PolB exonuclease-like 3'-5' exonuclease
MSRINLEKILFLDIETVPLVYKYTDLNETLRDLWDRKWQYNRDISPQEQYNKAGIYAEFAKVVCIGLGYYKEGKFKVGTIASVDEHEILTQFADFLAASFNGPQNILCAHNGKEFDFPFLCRRLIINGIPLPKLLQIQGLKPWEVPHLDTMDMWKFGDYKNYSSLNLLAHIFGIPSPKGDMDGSKVASAFYEENGLDRIAEYCKKDVITLAKVYSRFSGVSQLADQDVIFA